ncbi:MAG: tRNA (guanosine(37)-N1)-methyltransferase TrmD, partial [Anaerovoracaceae bacterium]
GLIEYDQYTRPRNFRNMEVPETLLSGNHKKIEMWKLEQSLAKTEAIRPELLKSFLEGIGNSKIIVSKEKKEILNKYDKKK